MPACTCLLPQGDSKQYTRAGFCIGTWYFKVGKDLVLRAQLWRQLSLYTLGFHLLGLL